MRNKSNKLIVSMALSLLVLFAGSVAAKEKSNTLVEKYGAKCITCRIDSSLSFPVPEKVVCPVLGTFEMWGTDIIYTPPKGRKNIFAKEWNTFDYAFVGSESFGVKSGSGEMVNIIAETLKG